MNNKAIFQGEKMFKYGQIIKGFPKGVPYHWRQIDCILGELKPRARLNISRCCGLKDS